MRQFHKTIDTPWGRSQHGSLVAEGITSVSTAGHGGYHLDEERQARVKELFPSFKTFAGGPWYEEDQDWCVVALAFPDAFPQEALETARKIVKYSAEFERSDKHHSRFGMGEPRGWCAVEKWLEGQAIGLVLV